MTKINYKEKSNDPDTVIDCGDWVQITHEDGDISLVVFARVDRGDKFKLISIDEYQANRYIDTVFEKTFLTLREIAKEVDENISQLEKVNVEINVTNES